MLYISIPDVGHLRNLVVSGLPYSVGLVCLVEYGAPRCTVYIIDVIHSTTCMLLSTCTRMVLGLCLVPHDVPEML